MSASNPTATTLTVMVHQPAGGALLEWRPRSGDIKLRELIRMLEDRRSSRNGGGIDLIERSTGRPVDPDSAVDALTDTTLVATDTFLSHALGQLAAYRTQYPSSFNFHSTPGSPVVTVELRLPGLVQEPIAGRPLVRLQGHHELLMVVPRSYPDAPPRMIWLTPIFHPMLVQDRDAWPPGFSWERQPSLLALMGGLVDMLVGLSAPAKGRLRFRRRRAPNPEASSWFRKREPAIRALGAEAVHGAGWAPGQMPLTSSNGEWLLEGALEGGGPLVLLSHRFRHGLAGFSEHSPGWLIGRQGDWAGSHWIYVHRISPYYRAASPPATAVGFSRGPMRGPSPPPARDMPLRAEARDGRPVLLVGPGAEEIGGVFVRRRAPSPNATPDDSIRRGRTDRIRVGTPSTRAAVSETMSPSASQHNPGDGQDGIMPLVKRTLAYARCAYCGSSRASDRQWGVCPQCRTDMHVECSEQLGGCPDTECARSPLYSGA